MPSGSFTTALFIMGVSGSEVSKEESVLQRAWHTVSLSFVEISQVSWTGGMSLPSNTARSSSSRAQLSSVLGGYLRSRVHHTCNGKESWK